ncbi:MAG: hypothetical protein VXZ77_03405 [Pseudomonadota bacterium]|nr:hypothetical protein [Pseudomonadota bacterium]
MELKRYLEVDSKTALEKIKSEHGEEALIISSDKVGNKTEVIVGVSKNEDINGTQNKEKGRTEAFRHALEANSNREIEKRSSREKGKNPWAVIEKLNTEILDIKSAMLEIKEQKEREKALHITEIDRKIESCGFDLAPIEECNKWQSVNVIVGKPGSGKTDVLKRLLNQMRQEEEVLLITLGNINPDKSLMSVLSKWKHSYLATEDPSILDKVEKMTGCFNRIFIEVDYTFTQEVLEHPLAKKSTVMICSGADQNFNSEEFFSETHKILPPLILTRLDLCSNLPSALNSLADSGAKINGTATGPWK